MSQGSGFVAHNDGKVVTNYHVIRGAGSAVVKFPDGAFYNPEGFLGIDPGLDIAILKISSPSREFPSLQLADASEVTVALASFASDRQTFPNPVRPLAMNARSVLSGTRPQEDLPRQLSLRVGRNRAIHGREVGKSWHFLLGRRGSPSC